MRSIAQEAVGARGVRGRVGVEPRDAQVLDRLVDRCEAVAAGHCGLHALIRSLDDHLRLRHVPSVLIGEAPCDLVLGPGEAPRALVAHACLPLPLEPHPRAREPEASKAEVLFTQGNRHPDVLDSVVAVPLEFVRLEQTLPRLGHELGGLHLLLEEVTEDGTRHVGDRVQSVALKGQLAHEIIRLQVRRKLRRKIVVGDHRSVQRLAKDPFELAHGALVVMLGSIDKCACGIVEKFALVLFPLLKRKKPHQGKKAVREALGGD
mmetsp:Transcript_37943/g.104306  ORF Transcript_37943/g.104306 Transcript_37943/m.104306 type:complete len:263 (+) Transcript_37943:218-1006(+)